jgi:chromosome partitioning protein
LTRQASRNNFILRVEQPSFFYGRRKRVRTVALAQQKGGVGKSAASINLACQAVVLGYKTALIDMNKDQGTTTKWARRRAARGTTETPFFFQADASSIGPLLSRLCDQSFDWVFIDLPGRQDATASAGLLAADFVVFPCRPLDVDIEASAATLLACRQGRKPCAYLMSVVSTQDDMRRAQQVLMALGQAAQAAGDFKTIPTIIAQRMEVPDAIAKGFGVCEFRPKGKGAQEIRELFTWLEREVR